MRRAKPEVLRKAMLITEAFEGGWLTGNFDGQLMSWGPLQWNLGQGTLQPVLRRIADLDRATMAGHLGEGFMDALADDAALERYVRANILTRNGGPKTVWQQRFYALGQEPAALDAFAEAAAPYVARAERDASRLGFASERGFASCLDVAVQNGGVRAEHEARYRATLHSYLAKKGQEGGDPAFDLEEWEHLKALAYAVADSARPRYREDVLSRKLTLALGQGWVHGRAYDLLEDFGLAYWQDRAAGIKATWYEAPN